MPKRQRTQTGRGRPYAYSGLTPQEASARAKKAWITKRRKYKYGEKHTPVWRVATRRISSEDEPEGFERTEFTSDDPAFQGRKRDRDDRRARVEAEAKEAGLSYWQRRTDEVAKEFAETGTIGKDFERELAGFTVAGKKVEGATQEVRDEFVTKILKAQKQREELNKIRVARKQEEAARFASRKPEGGMAADDPYAEDIESKQIMNRLSRVIGNNPSQRGFRVSPAHDKEVGDYTAVREVTPEQLDKEVRQALRGTSVLDPNRPKGTMDQLDVVRPQDKEAFRQWVHRSYFAPSEHERSYAANRARRYMDQFAQETQRAANDRRLASEVREMESKLPPKERPAPAPDFDRIERAHYNAQKFYDQRIAARHEIDRLKASGASQTQINNAVLDYARAQRQHEDALSQVRSYDEYYKKSNKYKAEKEDIRELHNELRAKHGLPPLDDPRRIPRRDPRKPSGQPPWPQEQRLGGVMTPITTEDAYEFSGHETERGPKAWRKQWAFNKRQAKAKVEAFKTGAYTHGFNENARTVAPGDATFRIGPNAEWHYTLRDFTSDDPNATKKEVLSYWDTKTEHRVGRRDSTGRLMPDERDELVREQLVKRFNGTYNFSPGERQLLKGSEPLKDWESKEVVIPLKGVQPTTRHVTDPESKETYEVKQVQDINGRWRAASDAEWYQARAHHRAKLQTGGGTGISSPNYRTTRMPQQIRVTHADMSQTELKGRQRDTGSVRIPGRGKFGERVGDVSIDKRSSNKLEHAFKFSHARRERELRERSQQVAWESDLQKGIIPHSSHTRDIISAAGASIYYGSQEKVRKGRAPNFFNKQYEKAHKKYPKLGRIVNPNARLDVEEAYIRPGLEFAGNKKWQFWHPLSDPEGRTFGIDWGTVYHRSPDSKFAKWVPIDPNKATIRDLRRREAEINRVVNTQDMISDWAYKGLDPNDKLTTKVRAAYVRWRMDPVLKHKDYRTFFTDDGILQRTLAETEDVMLKHGVDGFDYNTPRLRQEHHIKSKAASQVYGEAARVRARASELLAKQSESAGRGGELVLRGRPRSSWDRRFAGDFTGGEKAAATVTAIAGTALAGHYLYHKYQNSKLPQDERRSYLERITPGPITTKVPYARSTGHWRISPDSNLAKEFNLQNKRVPVQFGAGIKEKQIWKGKPSDRGYTASKVGLGIRSGRKGTAKGSFGESLFFDMEPGAKRRRTFRKSGGQLIIGGKKLPIHADIGSRVPIKLSASNPNKLNQADRENIVWAFRGTADEPYVKDFFHSDKIAEMFEDEEALRQIQRRKRGAEGKMWERAITRRTGVGEGDIDKGPGVEGTGYSTTMHRARQSKWDDAFDEGAQQWRVQERPVGTKKRRADEWEAGDPVRSRDISRNRKATGRG